MERFEYSGLLVLFLLPTVWLLLYRFRKELKKIKKLIIASCLFGLVGYFIVIPVGAYWEAWGYDYNKTWNLRIGADLLETLLWTIAGCLILSLIVGVYANREDKKTKGR